MSERVNPEVSIEQRPDPAQLSFELSPVLESIVGIRSHIPDQALTAPVLGTERAGHGISIDDRGLVVTISYLIMEADSVWVMTGDGGTVQGHVLGYDQETGLGLVQAVTSISKRPIALGSIADLEPGDDVIVASHGGLDYAMTASICAKREFAGYWEYLLDEALFTSPAHPSWGGAGLIDAHGALCGVGSLLVQEASDEGEASDCNMFVPIDLLRDSIEDLKRYGRPNRPARPWLGVFVYDLGENLVVAGVYSGGPADRADLRPGDAVIDVAGQPVTGLSDLFRSVWALGDAGVQVPLTVLRDDERVDIDIESADRTLLGHIGALH